MKHTAFAPASIGNVCLGFDVLGAAIAPLDGTLLGDSVTLQAAESFSLQVHGKFAHKLPPEPENNIITHCYQLFHQRLREQGKSLPPCQLSLDKNLPIGSGLGSSASSIVAALHGLNSFYDNPFSEQQLLFLMGELEGQISGSVHYDNVAPCYMGGLTLTAEQQEDVALSLPVIESWYWVVCYSGISVSTSAARKILPKEITLADTITFGRQLAVFVDALHRQDSRLAAAVMQDVIAEPHRKSLLPGFDESREFALQNGAQAFSISGSGPTVFAICPDLEQAETISRWLSDNYVQNQDGFSHVCQLDLQGSRVLKES